MLGIQQVDVLAQASKVLDVLGKALQVPWLDGHVDLRAALIVGVNPVALQTGLQTGEVLPAQSYQGLNLIGPMRDPVGQTMGKRRVAEAAVAGAGPEPALLGFEHHYPEAGLVF